MNFNNLDTFVKNNRAKKYYLRLDQDHPCNLTR